MNILITGAEGMVGSRLVKFMGRAGFNVATFEGDVTRWNDWSQYIAQKWDGLIHLAALAGVRRSFKEPELYYHNNVIGTDNALAFGAKVCNKVLYTSSSNAYEWWGNPYATTKKMNEVQARNYKAIGMRFHTVWPGRDDMLYRKLERGEVTYINNNHYRDFIHVEDLMNGILTIYNNYDKLVYERPVCDIGTGHATPVSEVAKMMGYEGEYVDENPAGERVRTCADNGYLLKLGWTPTRNILIKEHHTDYE